MKDKANVSVAPDAGLARGEHGGLPNLEIND